MKSLFQCLVFLLFTTLPVLAVVRESSSDLPVEPAKPEDEVLKMEQQWQEALLASDVAALDRIYAPSIVYTHSNGAVDNKENYIANIRSGATKYQTLVRDDIKVQVFGASAIVTCHWKVQTMARGTLINTDARYLHVYVREHGQWRMVAHQSTKITQ